ncbi:MAG: hypothetical protein ABJK25_15935 [Halieaceae bacterium]
MLGLLGEWAIFSVVAGTTVIWQIVNYFYNKGEYSTPYYGADSSDEVSGSKVELPEEIARRLAESDSRNLPAEHPANRLAREAMERDD